MQCPGQKPNRSRQPIVLLFSASSRGYLGNFGFNPQATVKFELLMSELEREIAERMRAESALRESEDRFGAIFNQTAVGIVLSAPDGRWLRVNRKLCDILGYDESELTNFHFESCTHPDDIDSHLDLLARLKAGEIPVYDKELRLIQKDGSIAWAYITVSMVRDAEGAPDYFVTVIEDIWRRARIQEALRESQTRYQEIFDEGPTVLWVEDWSRVKQMIDRLSAEDVDDWHAYFAVDRDRVIEAYDLVEVQQVSNASLDLYGATNRQQILGTSRGAIVVPEELDAFVEVLLAFIEGRWSGETESVDNRIDGTEIVLHTRYVIPLARRHDWSRVIYSLEDVTQHRRLEAQLRETQKLEALGQLTAGVAHEFNNLMQAIVCSLEVIRDKVRGDDLATRMISNAQRSAYRGQELTWRLLSYVGKQPLKPEITDLGGFVVEMVELLEPFLGETIEIEIRMADDLWPVKVDQDQLQSALLILATNARDAIPDGGRLVIECTSAQIDDAFAADYPYPVTPGDYVKLAVTDTGTGMSPEVREKAFDPFFTTKDVGQGTGLGLSMVYGFVTRQSGGLIDIDSEEGRGTTVALYLPRGEAEGANASRPDRGSKRSSAGTGTILVVEDDAAVLESMAHMVEALGYAALGAKDGAEAMSMLEQAGDMDLLLTDVVLPGDMSGIRLAEAFQNARPLAKTILMSGYPESQLGAKDLLASGVRLLNKPFQKDKLASAITETLGERKRKRPDY